MKTQNTTRDMLWNAGGNLSYLFSQWLVTVAVTRIFSFGSAGILSVAMSLSSIFQTVALFGMRNYQVSDVSRKYADGAYFAFRHLSVLLSLLLAIGTALLLGYRSEAFLATLLYMLFRLSESYSDVLHGISQRAGRLDLAGRGFALKSVTLLLGFAVGFLLGRALLPALLGMLFGSLFSTLLYDLPTARRLSPFSLRTPLREVLPLAKETFPLCIYFFMFSSISSVPKFVLEKLVGTELLGAYASIFAPALLLAGLAGYVYAPFIPTFASYARTGEERGFRRLVGRVLLALVALLLLLLLAAHFLGEWALALVFGDVIRPYAAMLSPILVAILALAVLAFFCMLAVVRRRFLALCVSVGAGASLSLLLSFPLIRALGANGASTALLMASLAATLLLSGAVFRRGIRGESIPSEENSPLS